MCSVLAYVVIALAASVSLCRVEPSLHDSSDSKPAAKEKGKGKEEKKPEFTKKRRIIHEIIVDDSDDEEEASTSSNSSETFPNSQKKTE